MLHWAWPSHRLLSAMIFTFVSCGRSSPVGGLRVVGDGKPAEGAGGEALLVGEFSCQTQSRQPPHDAADGDSGLQACELRPQAGVDPLAEGDVRVGTAPQVQGV